MIRVFLIFVLLAIIAAGGVAFYLYQDAGGEGSSNLEQWLAQQIVAILQEYVSPKIELASLDYQAPYTVVVEDLSMRSLNEEIIVLDRLTLTLDQIPRRGQPIKIREIKLENPTVRLISLPEGGLVGWSDFIKTKAVKSQQSVPKERRLSEVFVIRHLEIVNGEIRYESTEHDRDMVFPGIDFAMNTPPIQDQPGWYALEGQVKKDQLARIDLQGRINVDTALLDMEKVRLEMELDEGQYSTLPPQIQKILTEHQVKGKLIANVDGETYLNSPERAQVNADVNLTDANVSTETASLPIRLLHIEAHLADQRLKYDSRADLLQGSVHADGVVATAGDQKLLINWQVEHIQMEDAFRSMGNETSKMAGKIGSRGTFAARMNELPGTISGEGTIDVTEGRLVNIPVIAQLILIMKVPGIGEDFAKKDQASAKFRFHPQHIQVLKANMVSPVIAARGDGKIAYDGSLDLTVWAGPVKKIESVLGKIGETIGKVTDQLLSYRVTGNVENPKVVPQPLNIRFPGS
jgi:hypothetical protein